MTRARYARLLGGFLGVTYIVLGLVETTIALRANDPIGFFWFPALCGGGALVLAGVFKNVRPPKLSIGLVTVGALAGGLATAWTIVGPILSVALIFLSISSSPARAPSRVPVHSE